VELPLWRGRKQTPLARAAEHEVDAARRDLADAEAAARSEAAALLAKRERAGVQILRLEQGILPQTELAFEAARASYQAGRGDFSMAVEDYNLWLEARVELAKLEKDRFAAWAGLEALTAPAAAGTDGGTK
jgi:outer membrane protein TolC